MTSTASLGREGRQLKHNRDKSIRSLKRYIACEVFGIIMRRQKQINQAQITA
jgi:transposase